MSMQSFNHSIHRSPHSSATARIRRAPIASSLACVLTLALGAALSGCADKPAEPAAAPEVAATPPKADASVCQASASWITSPNPPSEVAATESFCDFYQFSWQWFLAEVSPSPTSQGERVFETNRLHDPNVSSGQCSLPEMIGRAAAAKMLAKRADKPQDFEDTQADGNALYDRNGNILHYNIWYSRAECQATQAGFAEGTFEIKVSWMTLPKPDPSYYTMQATLPGSSTPVTLAMVGFHIANWTSKHPEMIWATFEHKNNAPLCDGSTPTPSTGWAFASSDAAACLTQNPTQPGTPPNTACATFNFNTPDPFQGNPPATNTANNICRMFANGNQPGASINGNDNAANLLAIDQLNDQLVGSNGLLTQLPDTDPMAIWKNYTMIGAIWTKGGANSGNPPVSYTVHGKDGDKIVPGDPTSLQRGSLELTNMSMETFQQGETSWAPNCFGCHGFSTTDPLDVSHICTSLFGQDANGNCVVQQTETPPVADAKAAAPAAAAKK